MNGRQLHVRGGNSIHGKDTNKTRSEEEKACIECCRVDKSSIDGGLRNQVCVANRTLIEFVLCLSDVKRTTIINGRMIRRRRVVMEKGATPHHRVECIKIDIEYGIAEFYSNK